MNPQNSNGWPPTTAPGIPPVNPELHPQMQQRLISSFGPGHPLPQGPPSHMANPAAHMGNSVLPPPGPIYGGQSNGSSLHALAGMTQASPSQSARPVPAPLQQQQPSPSSIQQHHQVQGLPPPQQGPGYSLPGISHAIQQQSPRSASSIDREREYRLQETRDLDERQRQRAQDIRDLDERQRHQDSTMRDPDRERELREPHQPPHETNASSIPLQQPVASRPAMLHGPNGILSPNSHVGNSLATASLGAPNGPVNVFASSVPAAHEATGRVLLQHQGQNIPPQQLLGLGAAMVPQQLQNGIGVLTQGQQPILNDALSYLDQVKVRFVEHPDVYNRFLDIMKDFKSQAIDTPGVIERVSTLFNGHPELIQGFNTFLPPGYRIECGTHDDPNSIRVTTPMGTTTSQMTSIPNHINGGPNGHSVENSRLSPRPNYPETTYRTMGGNWLHPTRVDDLPEGTFSPNSVPRALELYAREESNTQGREDVYGGREDEFVDAAALAHQQEQQGVSQLQNAITAATNGGQVRPSMMQESPGGESAMTLGQAVAGLSNGAVGAPLAAQLGMEKRGPVEFNHAISYVNKIKNRFATQPEIYKQFLEILQTYQRESKPIQDVYAQVTQLFNAAPDLLEDFKQFLPESAAQAKAQAAARQATEDAAILSNVRGEPSYLANIPATQAQTPRPDAKMPPIGNFAPPPSAGKESKKRRGGPGSQITGGAAALDAGSLAGNQGNRVSSLQSGNPPKRARVQQTKPTTTDAAAVSPSLIPVVPHPIPPATSAQTTMEEIAFFDRVRKFISNKQTFNEFLKLCNLFSQDLIDKNVLIHKSANFFGGNPDLMSWFKTFVLYDGRDEIVENKPAQNEAKVELSNCRLYGPSYRLLPKRSWLKHCSGRDEMCQRVLNDEWASHPTWASEDSGFVAHRKNQFEEALHRMEEERHDYDFNIETCLRTIQLLEPIVHQIKIMTEDERQSYRLPHGLGGQSEAIYQRVIKKIYGRERGIKVIEDMFVRPAAVCPVLVGRLKQKAEEWKTGQREWEKVWREQTHRQFWKSLDHQGISAKADTKRQFQPKQLQSDIQARYEEQKRQRIIKWADTPRYQFEYHFGDPEVIQDTCHILLAYLHFSHPGNGGDQAKLQAFLKTFVPAFFNLDREVFQNRMSDIYDTSPPNEEMEEDLPVNEDSTSHRGRRGVNGKKANLLRGVLDRGPNGKPGRKDKESGALLDSKESTPDVTSVEDDPTSPVDTSTDQSSRIDNTEHRWMDHPPNARNRLDLRHNEPYPRDTFSLYANVNIYCFMRMFQLLFERLLNIKEAEEQVHESVRRAMAFKPAFDLKIADKSPSEFFEDTSPNANYYQQVLKMCEDFVRGRTDMVHLEDTLRRFYLQHGWQLFNFDKILASMTRFAMQLVVSDTKDKSSEIINLFYKNRKENDTTHQAEIDYRKQVEKLAKDSDIYRIVYNRVSRRATIQIFKREDKTFETDEMTAEAMWSYYISSYVMRDRTEGVPHAIQWPYLRRNLPSKLNTEEDYNAAYLPQWNEDGLVIRICPNSYHLLYDGGTTDWWVHHDKVRRRGLKSLNDAKEERDRKFRGKFCDSTKWMQGMSPDEIAKVNKGFENWMNSGPAAAEEGTVSGGSATA